MGRIAVVLGGGSGIGLATARHLSAAGFAVATVDRDETALAAVQPDVSELSIVADGGDAISIDTAVEEVVSRLGSIEAWISCAGQTCTTPVAELTATEWEETVASNLSSVVFLARAAMRRFARDTPATFVAVSSGAGILARTDDPAYGAVKAGVVSFVRSIGVRYAAEGLLAVSVCPGPVDTPMLRRGVETAPSPEAALKAVIEMCPLKRLISPEEIAEPITWICDKRPMALAGSALVLDGGKSSALQPYSGES